MEAAGITNIRHTTLTLKDVVVQWEQFQKFLVRLINFSNFFKPFVVYSFLTFYSKGSQEDHAYGRN